MPDSPATAEPTTASQPPSPDGLTIDELAHRTGMTARNIRAHQSRGLLPAPSVHGRTGYYGPEHVSRIELIQRLQADGFNLAAIGKLIEAEERGGPGARRFRAALLSEDWREPPEEMDASQLAELFGGNDDPKLLKRAEKLGALRPLDDGRWQVVNPTLLRAAALLVDSGIPLSHIVAVGEATEKATRSIAKEYVRLFVRDVLDPLREGPTAEREAGYEQAAEALEKLRPLAADAVVASFSQQLGVAIEQELQRDVRRARKR